MNLIRYHEFINDNSVDLVVVGPEQPLVNGIVDYLEKFNIKVFGLTKLLLSLKGLKFLLKNSVKNITFLLLTLVFLKIELMQKNF